MNDTATRSEISLVVNGERTNTSANTLAELLASAGYGAAKVATAVNGSFDPEARRATVRLAAGDHVEIVAPRQGG